MNEKETIQDEAVDSNLMNAEALDAIIIEGRDGKEYRITKALPVKAGNIFNQLIAKFGFKEPSEVDDIIEVNNKMMEMLAAVIIAANHNKYPHLTRDLILGWEDENGDYQEGIFDEFELGTIYSMYLSRWIEMQKRRMKSKSISKKKAMVQGIEGV